MDDDMVNRQMQAIQVIEKGKIEVATSVPLPLPTSDQIRIKVYAVGLNPVDNLLITGYVAEQKFPFTLGLDAAGIVDQVGSEVHDFKVGDRVFYHGDYRHMGAFAEYACITAHTCCRLPSCISFAIAASLPCAGITAYHCLYRRLPIKSGDTILITSGSGGVGGFAIQLARHLGCTVIATCGHANIENVRKLGAHHVIDYGKSAADVVGKVMEITDGKGVKHCIDGVSGEYSAELFPCISWGGHLCYISGQLPFLPPFYRSLTIHQIGLGSAYSHGPFEVQRDIRRMGEELVQLIASGIIVSRIDPNSTSFTSLRDIPTALERLSHKHVVGKLVVKVIDDTIISAPLIAPIPRAIATPVATVATV